MPDYVEDEFYEYLKNMDLNNIIVYATNKPCIKLREEFQKVTFPGKKNAFRLFDKDGCPLVDLLTRSDEPMPEINKKFLCRHPFIV